MAVALIALVTVSWGTRHRRMYLGAQLADTLAYVHWQGVVHRDIKRANVLLA